MECRSRRFQNIKRKDIPVQQTRSIPSLARQNIVLATLVKGEKKVLADEDDHVNVKQVNIKTLVFWDFLRHLCCAFFTCILARAQTSLEFFARNICQEEVGTHVFPSDFFSSQILSPPKRLAQYSHQQQSLFSSDDEEDDDKHSIDYNSVDDYDISFVYFFDVFIHFISLFRTNYPAFVHEVSQAFKRWLSSEKPVIRFGLLIDAHKKRPRILQAVTVILKKQEFVKRMTRVKVDDRKNWVLRIAVVSRIVIFLIQVVVTNYLEVFKHQNDGFKFTPEKDYGKLLDPLVNSTFGGYVNWDAHYFLHVSVYGYTSESMLAFFPLLSMMLYLPSKILYLFLSPVISLSSIVIVCGVLLNTLLFVRCVKTMYELAHHLGDRTPEMLTTASLFFVFNPASIFFSGLYTETLFAYLTSKMMLSLFERKPWSSLVYAGLSGLCRSNGILNAGFVIAFSLQLHLIRKRGFFRVPNFLILSAVKIVMCWFPFFLFQVYGMLKFCDERKLYDADPSEIPAYCLKSSKWLLPNLPYSYVQTKYWNVGFLRYFQLKQIPNFVLALPVLYLLGSESWSRFKKWARHIIIEKSISGVYAGLQALHGIFLTFFCFFFVHVQVSTRMIMAACPYFLVYMTDSYLIDVARFRNGEVSIPVRSLSMVFWCATYFIVGTIGFSLGLPWT